MASIRLPDGSYDLVEVKRQLDILYDIRFSQLAGTGGNALKSVRILDRQVDFNTIDTKNLEEYIRLLEGILFPLTGRKPIYATF